MDYSKILTVLILFTLNNVVIWYQLNGQLVWDWWRSTSGIMTSLLLGIPITGLFWLCTKWGYEGFGELWPTRFIGFATSMITFPIMTWFYLGESITLKTFVTIILSIAIMVIQLI